MIHHLSKTNSLVSVWMSELRNQILQKDRQRFRNNIEKLGEVIAYEISKTLPYKKIDIETPLGTANCNVLISEPIIATIFRAGFPLFQGLLNYFDKADCAFIGAYRKHTKDGSFKINQEYVTCPNINKRTLIVADPMLASGASLIRALDALMEYGKPDAVHVVVAIACTDGIDTLHRKYPEFNIWAGDIDNKLSDKGYIIPGLGDAGDLSFGSKMQQ